MRTRTTQTGARAHVSTTHCGAVRTAVPDPGIPFTIQAGLLLAAVAGPAVAR
ncbi:hypothetical protein ACWC5I_34925 [Kitasatospora sp. NPDC001574]